MESTIGAFVAFQNRADQQRNFCRICWGPLNECPGHQGYMEMFGPPPTDEQRAAYLADLEVRQRGLERRAAALDEAARKMGYEDAEDLANKVLPDGL